jgi:hypothetical protein
MFGRDCSVFVVRGVPINCRYVSLTMQLHLLQMLECMESYLYSPIRHSNVAAPVGFRGNLLNPPSPLMSCHRLWPQTIAALITALQFKSQTRTELSLTRTPSLYFGSRATNIAYVNFRELPSLMNVAVIHVNELTSGIVQWALHLHHRLEVAGSNVSTETGWF